ncbi:MAG: hypothetical protein LC135_16180 [Phycisphaerae bacterium]|nr:hypothetical protein [Phycisphaerae bacterium]MCZ2401378.1 hypothetical protein [Phycisphaerae bacterium]
MRAVPNSARCRQCGYRLRGLSANVCPECGTAFDPSDPDSYDDPERRLEWLRRERRQALRMFIAPPGIVTYVVLAWLWAWQFRPTFSLAAWHQLVNHHATPIVCSMAILLMLWIPAGWLIHRRLDPALYPRWRNQGWWRWGLFSLLVASVLALAQPWGVWARFHLSRTALEAQIAGAQQGQAAARFRRIGWLDVEYVHLNWPRGGVFVQTEHDSDDGRYGFAYRAGDSGQGSTPGPGRWRIEQGPARWHP